MQCSCGGETVTHKVVENKVVIGKFEQCRACGRTHWFNKEQQKRCKEALTPQA